MIQALALTTNVRKLQLTLSMESAISRKGRSLQPNVRWTCKEKFRSTNWRISQVPNPIKNPHCHPHQLSTITTITILTTTRFHCERRVDLAAWRTESPAAVMISTWSNICKFPCLPTTVNHQVMIYPANGTLMFLTIKVVKQTKNLRWGDWLHSHFVWSKNRDRHVKCKVFLQPLTASTSDKRAEQMTIWSVEDYLLKHDNAVEVAPLSSPLAWCCLCNRDISRIFCFKFTSIAALKNFISVLTTVVSIVNKTNNNRNHYSPSWSNVGGISVWCEIGTDDDDCLIAPACS